MQGLVLALYYCLQWPELGLNGTKHMTQEPPCLRSPLVSQHQGIPTRTGTRPYSVILGMVI